MASRGLLKGLVPLLLPLKSTNAFTSRQSNLIASERSSNRNDNLVLGLTILIPPPPKKRYLTFYIGTLKKNVNIIAPLHEIKRLETLETQFSVPVYEKSEFKGFVLFHHAPYCFRYINSGGTPKSAVRLTDHEHMYPI